MNFPTVNKDFSRCGLESERKESVSIGQDNNREVDKIENTTLEIITNLHSLADGEDRSEIMKVIATREPAMHGVNLSEKRIGNVRRSLPFRRETNFNEQVGQIIQTNQVVNNIFNVLGKILLGYELFDSRTDSKMISEEKFKQDKVVWGWDQENGIWGQKNGIWGQENGIWGQENGIWGQENGIKINYSDTFKIKMNEIFSEAVKLLEARENSEKWASYGRIALYSLLGLSFIGKWNGYRSVTMFGLVSSSITFIFMLILYGKNSLEMSSQVGNLKSLLVTAEKVARNHRKSVKSS